MPEITKRKVGVYEIDTPHQMARKHAILAAAGVTLPAEVVCAAVRFRDGRLRDCALGSALSQRGFRQRAGAIFVWEGVIGYIDREAMQHSLRFMAHSGGSQSRLVFTSGEGAFRPETAAVCAKRAGFASCEEIGLDEVWRRYLPGEPHPGAWVSKVGTAIV